MSSAYATTQQERLIECSKAIHDVVHSRNVGKDCRIPIFGFGATILLNLLFLILQDNIELKARAMGVWEVISGLQTLNHGLPMDAAARLIADLKAKIDGKVADERAKARQELVMPYLKLSPKEIILAFNAESSGVLLDIPEALFTGPLFTNVERNRYAAWRNITHILPWVPACDADPLTQFDPLNWRSWHWLTHVEFAYAANIHGLPKQMLATRGPIFDYCDSTAHGMVALRGEYNAATTDEQIRTLAKSYNVFVDQQNSSATLLSNHKTTTAVDKALNDQCLLFFSSTFTPAILALVKTQILREDWAAAYSLIVATYSVNRPNELLPTRDIEAAIQQLKHDPYKFKVAETLVVFDQMMVLLHLAHYTNKPGALRPGATLALIKHNIRVSLPMTDAAFTLAHPGVTRHVEAHDMRELLLGVFRGVEHYQHKVDDWTYTKKTVTFAEIRDNLLSQETKPLKPRQPTPFAANACFFNPMDPEGTTSATSNEANQSALYVGAKGLDPHKAALQIPCLVCSSNKQRITNGSSHDAARCRNMRQMAENPYLAQQRGFTASLHSLGLPSASELIKLGDSLGHMNKSRLDNAARPPSPGSSRPFDEKRKASPSGQPAYPNQRNRFNPQTGSRQSSRRNSPAPSRPSSPSTRPHSPGGSILPRPPSPGSATTTQDPFLRGLQNPAFAEMLRSAIEKTVEKAMADRK